MLRMRYRVSPGLLGVSYLTLHLAVTAVVLLWLHRRRPTAFPFVRTTLLVASALAIVGFLAYPTAPPRLAGIGIADTASSGHVNLNHGLVSSALPALRRHQQIARAADAPRLVLRVLGAEHEPPNHPSSSSTARR